ncbi:MAG TPA: DEAD/DEAH box helicase [Campylobacterales bacterium]|nr:DEAD/DEAH box helicase [Campylobacterales bacterium]HHS92411.1 DEAD/DEAH box helicase [Campylobacterales bacterium]
MSFESLQLSSKLQQTLQKLTYNSATEIQTKAIPVLLKKRDLLASSQTGTGKTASFVLPMLENLEEPHEKKVGDERYKIQALILAPTRELVLQINEKIALYGENFSHKSVALYGGVKLGSQVSALRQGANIVVGTTSRVLNHVKNGTLDLSALEMLVLDEADKLLDMGFIDEIREISNLVPKRRHAVMFSATFTPSIQSLAKKFLNNPRVIEMDKDTIATKEVNQRILFVNDEEKMIELCTWIEKQRWKQVLVFTNTKIKANQIVDNLKAIKIKAKAIHGDKTQSMRNQALKEFKSLKIDVLVATDVAARGVDIVNLPYVINFELPLKVEDYIHRVGRTGRAGKKGLALSLVAKSEKAILEKIETLMGKEIETIHLEGTQSVEKITSNNKTKKVEKKVNMKKAKELAERMMEKTNMGKKETKNSSKTLSKGSRNKRHF